MKKQYYFILPIIIMFYLIFLILGNTYKNYKVNSKIKLIENYNNQTKQQNYLSKQEIAYINTNAYIEKTAKAQQKMINKWEEVIIITPQVKKEVEQIDASEFIAPKKENKIPTNMTNLQKWIYVFTRQKL